VAKEEKEEQEEGDQNAMPFDDPPITSHGWSTMAFCTDAVVWKSSVTIPARRRLGMVKHKAT